MDPDRLPSAHSGAQLAADFHRDLVAPVIAREFPRLRYAAGRLGSGSDVLGLDDTMSRDHDWGCRLAVLVDQPDHAVVPRLREVLGQVLPASYRGLPVRFPTTWDPRPVHRAEVSCVRDFAVSRLGFDPLPEVSVPDWLTLTGQGVLETIGGPVFHDTTREVGVLRRTLRWYPPDLERYVLAAGWQRVTQRLPMVGRTAERGQEIGSRLLCATLACDLIRLGFLLRRRWAPYPKWLELVCRTLPGGAELCALLAPACAGGDWCERESALVAAAELLLLWQRQAGFPTPTVGVIPFWDRPYRTVDPAVPQALLDQVTDPEVARLPSGVGSIEQWVDSTDVLTHPDRRAAVRSTYLSSLAT